MWNVAGQFNVQKNTVHNQYIYYDIITNGCNFFPSFRPNINDMTVSIWYQKCLRRTKRKTNCILAKIKLNYERMRAKVEVRTRWIDRAGESEVITNLPKAFMKSSKPSVSVFLYFFPSQTSGILVVAVNYVSTEVKIWNAEKADFLRK